MPLERPTRRRRALALTALACAALACGAGDEQPVATSPPSPATTEVEALREELDAERARGAELAAQLAWTQEQLASLARAAQEQKDANGGARAAVEATASAERESLDGLTQPWFDAAELAERGLPAPEVERLRELADAAQLEQAELQHRATRERWLHKPRYARALERLLAKRRNEVGEEDYDLLLYASGQPNRVVLSHVISGSPGEQAGFKPGDVVVRYADQRIFRGAELQRIVATGDAGEHVVVEVLRDGEPLRLAIERGPIGALLEPRRVWPSARR